MSSRPRDFPTPAAEGAQRPRGSGTAQMLRLAATLCSTPVALMLRQGAPGRQAHVAGYGLATGEYGALAARCLDALGHRPTVWIEDALAGGASPPILPHLRHLAAVRLLGRDGRTQGALCVAAPEPRRRDDGRLAALRLLSRQAMAAIAQEEALARASAARAAEARANAMVGALLDTAMDAFLVVDHDGAILRTNPAAERMFAVGAVEAAGTSLVDMLLPGPQRLELERRLRAGLPAASVLRIDMEALRADGSVFPVELAVSRAGGGTDDEGAIVVCVRDATEQKRSSARAEADLRAKTEFLSRLSHDIRTPLNGIIGLSDLTIEAGNDEDRDHYLRMMRDSAYGLLETVNSILDYSKIDSVGIQPVMRSFSPQTALTEVMKTLAARARDKKLDFRVIHRAHGLGRLIGDPGFLRQIAYNLVGNAIRFTDRGHVRVTVKTSEAENGRVAFVMDVEDSGIGIPAEEHERIFEAFTQAHVEAPQHRIGSGLGLAIARRLAEAMNGRIELESTQGIGSRFSLHLEFDQDQHTSEDSTAIEHSVGDHAQLHVLVVDDNDTNRLVAGRLVARNGYRVTEAATGPEAIEIAANDRPALVLMDLRLPGMNGLEAMASIRALPGCAHVPAIALTAHALVGDRDRFLVMGMEGYVAKPFSGEALLAEMDRVLGMARVRRIRASVAPAVAVDGGRFSRLLDSLDGNPRLFAIIARKAAQEFRSAADDLPRHLKQRDWPALIELVHRLKGSWPLYAAPGHAMLADRCMGTVSRRHAAASREPIAALCTALRDTAHALEQWLEEHRRGGR